jgi:hypothetical protein
MRSNIASIQGLPSDAARDLLESAVRSWRSSGLRVAGVLEERSSGSDMECSVGVLRNIVSGETQSLRLAVPLPTTSCRIDAVGAEAACDALLTQIEACDIIVLSKFGKLEAAKSGLYRAFERAVLSGKFVLTSVSPNHREAWNEFAPSAAIISSAEALQGWAHDLPSG